MQRELQLTGVNAQHAVAKAHMEPTKKIVEHVMETKVGMTTAGNATEVEVLQVLQNALDVGVKVKFLEARVVIVVDLELVLVVMEQGVNIVITLENAQNVMAQAFILMKLVQNVMVQAQYHLPKLVLVVTVTDTLHQTGMIVATVLELVKLQCLLLAQHVTVLVEKTSQALVALVAATRQTSLVAQQV